MMAGAPGAGGLGKKILPGGLVVGGTLGAIALATGAGAYAYKSGYEENWKGPNVSSIGNAREVLGISGGRSTEGNRDTLSRDVLADAFNNKVAVNNTIPIVIHQYPDRVYAETKDMNTRVSVDLPRGRF
jgi:hypothetical protein